MLFEPLTPGKTVEGNDIEAFKSDGKGKKFLYLMAGVHGDEVEGDFVLKNLFEWLKEENAIQDIPMIVIPIQNVDGYRIASRVNSNGVDLNRNFPTKDWTDVAKKAKYNPGPKPLSEPENIFLEHLFEKYPPGFIISIHSWKPVINFNGDAKDVAMYLSSYNEYPIADDIGYITPGSLGTYGPEKYGCGVVTFECPTLDSGITLQQVWEENAEGLKNLLQSELILKKLN